MKWQQYPHYRDSCIEWLGEVPEHWVPIRLKFAAELGNDKVEASLTDRPYIGMENIGSGYGTICRQRSSDCC